MKTVSDMIDTIGRGTFADRTGHGQQVISRAIRENVMPAAWYVDVRDLCAEMGVEVPEHLFRWSCKRKSPSFGVSSDG